MNDALINRRYFLKTTAAVSGGLTLTSGIGWSAEPDHFSFALLGDLHFDRLEHHDMEWLKLKFAQDISQVQNYSRITRELTPKLFTAIKDALAELRKSATPPALAVQTGDLVEGLCGSRDLAARQNREAIAMVKESGWGVPFLFSKGNHDITGEGAKEAFQDVFIPFLATESARIDSHSSGEQSPNYAVQCGNALFCFYDGYDRKSLDWLEGVLAHRKSRHLFVITHQPVVPYGARATWSLYSNPNDRLVRDKFLSLLGQNEAYVLTGHLHRFNLLVRTVGKGRFVQLAASSVVPDLEVLPKQVLSGKTQYNGDQVIVEPSFSPSTESERRAVYAAEAPFVEQFEYADLPGYVIITVAGEQVKAAVYMGVTRKIWKSFDLSALRT